MLFIFRLRLLIRLLIIQISFITQLEHTMIICHSLPEGEAVVDFDSPSFLQDLSPIWNKTMKQLTFTDEYCLKCQLYAVYTNQSKINRLRISKCLVYLTWLDWKFGLLIAKFLIV